MSLAKDLIATALTYISANKSSVVGTFTVDQEYQMNQVDMQISGNSIKLIGKFTPSVSGSINTIRFIVYDTNNLAAIDVEVGNLSIRNEWSVAAGNTYTVELTITWSWQL